MHLAGAVAAQDHRFLAHARDGEIAGPRDLAFMADKEPGARKDPLQFLLVDCLVDEDLAADLPGVEVNQARAVTVAVCSRHGSPRRRARRHQNRTPAYVANQ